LSTEKISFFKKVSKFIAKNENLTLTVFAIIAGLLVGGIVLLATGYDPIEAYAVILKGISEKPSYVSQVIIKATPLIITGLSVGFAFKTGLFNIGAEGQFIVGATTAAMCGYFLQLPWPIHIPVVMLAAMLAAGVWGGFAGFLKARFGINEVISTIMLNWIAFYLHNYLIMSPFFNKPNSEASYSINNSASLVVLEDWKTSPDGIAFLTDNPFWKDLFRTPMNYGFVIAILAAVAVWFILNKTTLGYKLRAVGYNKHAAEYGGINVKTNMITAMSIAGMLSGLAGALHVMGVSKNITLLAGMEGYGFDGIAVSLIGSNSAAGSVLAGLLFGSLKYGGGKMQNTMGAPSEIISIVIGTIVFFIAISKFVKAISKKIQSRRSLKNV